MDLSPILGFLATPPAGEGPRASVARVLRQLGILALAGVAISLVDALLAFPGALRELDGAGTAAALVGALTGLLIGLAVTALFCFWITYTLRLWAADGRNAGGHVLAIGVVATAFGALGAVSGLGALAVGAAGQPALVLFVLLRLALAVAELACGILLLSHRSKALAPRAAATG